MFTSQITLPEPHSAHLVLVNTPFWVGLYTGSDFQNCKNLGMNICQIIQISLIPLGGYTKGCCVKMR